MKKIGLRSVIRALLLMMTFAGLSIVRVNADTVKTSLTVSPPSQSVILTPGETYQGSIKVSSRASSDAPMHYEVLVGSFSENGSASEMGDDYGTVDYVTESSYNQMMDWIVIDESNGIVNPNETKVVPFKIVVPEDAPAGGQYASLIVRDTSPNYSEGQGVAVQNVIQILSIIYAEVAGETRNEGVVLENSMPSFLLSSPLGTNSMVRNDGNVHAVAEYTLQVWPLFSDEEICTNEENPEKLVVLPETKRYNSQSCDLPAIGIFRAKQIVKIFGETSIVEKTVIVCPIWLMFIIIFAIFALIFYFVAKSKNRKKAAPKKPENA